MTDSRTFIHKTNSNKSYTYTDSLTYILINDMRTYKCVNTYLDWKKTTADSDYKLIWQLQLLIVFVAVIFTKISDRINSI